MFIPELAYPGQRPAGLSTPELAQQVNSLLLQMATSLGHAAIALARYDETKSSLEPVVPPDRAALLASARSLIELIPDGLAIRERERLIQGAVNESHRDRKRQLWETGAWPVDYANEEKFLYVNEFIYSMDEVGRCLDVMKRFLRWPTDIDHFAADWQRQFPGLRDVRNSFHHPEDRSRGMTRDRELELQPSSDGYMSSHSQILGGLFLDRFTCTGANGRLAGVDITSGALSDARDIIQRLINSWPTWEGARGFRPLH